MQFGICTTNYQCAYVLDRSLGSVFEQMRDFDFEYIVVDNISKDGNLDILRRWESENSNMKVPSKRRTMGEGRQISHKDSKGEHILAMDTDAIYYPKTKDFLNIYLDECDDLAVQALFLGASPRDIWEAIDGRRCLNAFEDVDMWKRIWKLDKMRWYPVFMGENVKEASASGGYDYLSTRYGKRERLFRFLRKEYDLVKTGNMRMLDLERIWDGNLVNFGLGEPYTDWFKNYPKPSPTENVKRFGRQMKATLKG